MKNLVKVFGIIAVIAVIGLAVSCEAAPEDQILVTFTGIPDAFNGKYATVSLVKDNAIVAIGYPKKINGGTVNDAEMLVAEEGSKQGTIFDKDGNYHVSLVVSDDEEVEAIRYSGITTSPKALVKGSNTFGVDTLRPDITKAAGGTPAEDFFGTYTGTGYKTGVIETIVFTETSFKISDDENTPNDYLDFTITKWDNATVPDSYKDTYTIAYKFTGKITAGKPVTNSGDKISIYGTATAPGFSQSDIDNGTVCHMYIYCKGSGGEFEFIRTTFTKEDADTDVTDAVAGNRVFTKK